MYSPQLFHEDDTERLFALIERYNFGTLIVADGATPEISHLPVILDRASNQLRGHVARGNRIAQLAASGRSATMIFHGPRGYVSPRWYERPTEQVPTWNYAVVHVHGALEGPMTREELLALLDALSAKHEGTAAEPWRRSQLEASFVDGLAQAIVGVTLTIARIEGKLKLSQNRSPADQERVVEALAARGQGDDTELAALMREVLR